MKKMNKNFKSSGFTLIELMIVIVIIGILSGVLIGIINPSAQQAKAKDGVTKATINKLALGAQAYVSANGRVPYGDEFVGEFTANVTGVTCVTLTGSCLFTVGAAPLPSTCSGNWSGTGAAQCNFYYCAGDDGGSATIPSSCTGGSSVTSFKLIAKAYNTTNLYMYRSTDSKLYLCNAAGTTCE